MTFLKYLQGIGDRLGILEISETRGSKPAGKIQTRTVTLAELASEIQSANVQALADSPAELKISFKNIFEAAGILSPSGKWSIETVIRFVSSEPLKNQPREKIQETLLKKMKADNAQAEDIVKSAIARDLALDSYENSAREKVITRGEARKTKIRDLESEIRDLQGQISRLEEKERLDEEMWTAWLNRKRAYERELAAAVSYVVDHPVISTDGDPKGS